MNDPAGYLMPSTSGSCFSRATRFSINRDREITRPSCCMCAERTLGDSSCAPSILPVERGNVPVLAVSQARSQARRTHSGWHHVTRVSLHRGAVGRHRKLGVPEARGQRGPLDFFGRIGISWDARMACPEGLEPPTAHNVALHSTVLPLEACATDGWVWPNVP
jgi:hypothetical protein